MQNSGGQESVVTAEPESFVDATTDEASTNEVDTAWDHQGLPESAAEVTADQEEPLAVPNSDDSTLEDIDNFYREGDALVENDVGGAIESPDMPEPDITEKSFLGNHVKFGIGTVLLIALISLFVKAFKFKR